MHVNGACHCGKVTFDAVIDAKRVLICHCTDCQVLSGAPFRAVALAAMDSFHVEGVTKSYVKIAQSGRQRAQVFCPDCGTPVYAADPENPKMAMIRIGCIAQRAQLVPFFQVWQRSAMPWLSALPDIPAASEQQLPAE